MKDHAWTLAALLALAACTRGEASPRASSSGGADADRPATVVDSILPIEEELRRFRAVIGPEIGALQGGADSRDALVERFVEALAASDTSALAGLAMTIDEFGWLFYPHTPYVAPPYELPPNLVWFQIENGSSRGLGRLLERLAGRPLDVRGYECSPEPVDQGPNRLWEGCTVRFTMPDEGPRAMALFGSILERDGVFKFVSFTNGF
jgi:hypothetical protein